MSEMMRSDSVQQEPKSHQRDLNPRSHVRKPAKKQKTNAAKTELGPDSNEAILLADVQALLISSKIQNQDGLTNSPSLSSAEAPVPLERFSTVEVQIERISSLGDGLGLSPASDHVYVVPFTLPGDVVEARIVDSKMQDKYTVTDFVRVIKPSDQRDDARIGCQYFSTCSGCQFQMMSYNDQLDHKKSVIEKAYKNFSKLAPEVIPRVGETIGSPLQYGYRTKLTPHFDRPGGPRREKRAFKVIPPIGFQKKGQRRTIDIESCPIGTPVLNLGMSRERFRVVEELDKYKKGATILLRESTKRVSHSDADHEARMSTIASTIDTSNASDGSLANTPPTEAPPVLVASKFPEYTEIKSCISDQNALSTEYVDDFKFENTAGAFFQNNNSILPRFTSYIRDNILPPRSKDDIKYLIDAYCGSGLFTVCLSSLFAASIGIDIAPSSIAAAHKNAATNKIANASFIAADASALFAKVSFPGEATAVVIDPPRKGCDSSFLNQLLQFGPKRVVYVSCNVHTQARDIGTLVEGRGGARYNIESLIGFDFFPQTSHVEGVAVLNRAEEDMPLSSNEGGHSTRAAD